MPLYSYSAAPQGRLSSSSFCFSSSRVIEGTDGSGKQTQSTKLLEYYKSIGLKVKSFSFPIYGSPSGKIVGGPYLGKEEICEGYFPETSAEVDPLVSSLYFAADRRYNFLKTIEPEIYKNDLIILDRYSTSNMGHQVGKARNKKERDVILNFLNTLEFELCELPKPDIVVFLHMPFEATIELRKGRKSGDGNENNPRHLKKAEEAYLYVADKYKWNYVKCIKTKKYKTKDDIKSIDEIFEDIKKITDKKINNKTSKINKMTRF